MMIRTYLLTALIFLSTSLAYADCGYVSTPNGTQWHCTSPDGKSGCRYIYDYQLNQYIEVCS